MQKPQTRLQSGTSHNKRPEPQGSHWYLEKLTGKPTRGRETVLKLPPGWKGNALPWDIGFRLTQQLNLRKESQRLESFRDIDRTFGVVRRVIDTLASEGLPAALREFNGHPAFSEVIIRFPVLEIREPGAPEVPRARPGRDENPLRGTTKEKPGQVGIFGRLITPGDPPLPASLCLWTILTDERIASRIRRCPVCQAYFLDMTKNRQQQRCSPYCTHRHWNRQQRRKAGHRASPPRRS